MASALMRHVSNYRVYAKSAGVHAQPTDPFAIAVMDEIGIDISAHRSITLADLHDTTFDLIISLSPEAHHQALEFTRTMAVEVEYWPTLDPAIITGSREHVVAAYRACRDHLFERIKARFQLTGAPLPLV